MTDVVFELVQFARTDPRVHGRHAAPGEIPRHRVVFVVARTVARRTVDGGADHRGLYSAGTHLGRAEQLGNVHTQGPSGGREFFVTHRHLRELHLRQGRQRHA
ncbi:hypothetical protein D3C86_1594110 [compost metagenome]